MYIYIYICVYIYIYIHIIHTRVDLSLYSDRVKWSSRLVFVRSVDGQHVLSMWCCFFISDWWLDVKLKGVCGWSWAVLRACVAGLGSLLGPLRAVLSHSWGLCWWSWMALGASEGGLGQLLGPMLTVLSGSWGLCGRSWAALGAMLTILGRLKAKSAPNPNLANGSERKSGPSRREKATLAGTGITMFAGPPGPRTHFFYRCVTWQRI